VSTDPSSIAILQGPCFYCGNYHVGVCPRIKAMDYDGQGRVARVEFYDSAVVRCTCPEAGLDPSCPYHGSPAGDVT
jgi:hypothetical protein